MSTFAPNASKLRYEDYAQIPEDGNRHEIIDGIHIVNSAPSTLHQHVSKRLQYQLYTKIELAGLGVLYSAPIDVKLSEFDIVQPDLLIVLQERVDRITAANIQGAPNLMVEIVSPSTGNLDRTLKKDLYERSSVQEYWMVDPFEQAVEQWVLREGKLTLFPFSRFVSLAIVPGIEIDFDTVW